MKVVLLENVRKVGSIGEIIDVKRGFARNYLISKKKALFASKENIKQVEKIKQELSKKDNEKKKDAKIIQEKIQNKELYGSVKPTEISKIISESVNIKINPSLIQPINEIKALGSFKIVLNLHSEIQASIILKVEPEETAK